jgi:hypothetical protein
VPLHGAGRLLEASSVPIVEQAREHAPNDDRRVSQYGLSGSDARTVRVVLGDGRVSGPSEVAVLSWGSQARRRPDTPL